MRLPGSLSCAMARGADTMHVHQEIRRTRTAVKSTYLERHASDLAASGQRWKDFWMPVAKND